MWNRKRSLGALAVVALAGIWFYFGDEKRTSPSRDSRQVTRQEIALQDTNAITPKTSASPNHGRNAVAERPVLSPSERETLQAVLLTATNQREAQRTNAKKARKRNPEEENAFELNLNNKTGSDTDWDRKQIEILNELLGECYDLAEEEEPGLSGTIGLHFILHAEPEIGGLVEGIEFMNDYSTIENLNMRECMRESLYALELDPPEEGVKIGRQITLRFDDEE